MAGPVCCGLIPHLELALHPELYRRPVVVARLGDRVITASEEAAAHGVLAGMTLRQAEALSPAVAVVEPQPEAACRLRERIADWLKARQAIVLVGKLASGCDHTTECPHRGWHATGGDSK